MKLQLNFAEKANNKSIIVHKTKKNHNSLCIRKNTQRKKKANKNNNINNRNKTKKIKNISINK